MIKLMEAILLQIASNVERILFNATSLKDLLELDDLAERICWDAQDERGNNYLQVAIRLGNIYLVKLAMGNVQIDHHNDDGETALDIARGLHFDQAVLQLEEVWPEVCPPPPLPNPELLRAIREKKHKVVGELLQRGDHSVAQLQACVEESISHDSRLCFRTLLEVVSPNFHMRNRIAPLHMSVTTKFAWMLQPLLRITQLDLNFADRTGKTVLHHCVLANNGSFAPMLLYAGANPTIRDHNGISAVVLAMQTNRHDMAQLFFHNGVTLQRDEEEEVLILAEDIIVLYLNAGWIPSARSVNYAIVNNVAITTAILQKYLSAPVHPHFRPVDFIHIVVLLTKHQHEKGLATALHTMNDALWHPALTGGLNNILHALVLEHIDITAFLTTAVSTLSTHTLHGLLRHHNAEGKTPMYLAVSSGNVDAVKAFARCIPAHNLLVFTKQETSHNTLLHAALALRAPKQMLSTLFKELKLDEICDRFNKKMHAALHIAVAQQNYECVGLLLNHGCNPNAENSQKQTPLHKSAQLGSIDITRLLLSYGADPSHADGFGRTALYYACGTPAQLLVLVGYVDGFESLVDADGLSVLEYAAKSQKRYQSVLHLHFEKPLQLWPGECVRRAVAGACENGRRLLNFLLNNDNQTQTVETFLSSGAFQWEGAVANHMRRALGRFDCFGLGAKSYFNGRILGQIMATIAGSAATDGDDDNTLADIVTRMHEDVAAVVRMPLYLTRTNDNLTLLRQTLDQMKSSAEEINAPFSVSFANELGRDDGGLSRYLYATLGEALRGYAPARQFPVVGLDSGAWEVSGEVWQFPDFGQIAQSQTPTENSSSRERETQLSSRGGDTPLMLGHLLARCIAVDKQPLYLSLPCSTLICLLGRQFDSIEHYLAVLSVDDFDLYLAYMKLLNADDAAEQIAGLDLKMEADVDGRAMELLSGGSDVALTHENFSTYVLLKLRLAMRPDEKMQRMVQGFQEVLLPSVSSIMSVFQARRLIEGETKVSGEDVLERTRLGIDDMHDNAVQRRCFDVFVQLVRDEMSGEELSRLLEFWIGSGKLAFDDVLHVHVHPEWSNEHLPISHTCAKLLDLPPIEDLDKLRRKIALASSEGQSFSII